MKGNEVDEAFMGLGFLSIVLFFLSLSYFLVAERALEREREREEESRKNQAASHLLYCLCPDSPLLVFLFLPLLFAFAK